MTKAQKRLRELEERRSKDRGRMAELALLEELTEEHRGELETLEKGIPDLELQTRAAKRAAEDEEDEQLAAGAAARKPEDGEDRERLGLRSKISLAGYLSAAVEMRSAAGAEAEYLDAVEIPLIGRNGGTAFPLELLAPALEHRATTDTDTVTSPRRWVDRLFAETAAMACGITMESVEPGIASFPVTTAGPTAAQRGRTEAAADAGWTISASELKPTRNVVSLKFAIADAARIPGLESGLTRDMRKALVEGVDRAIFLGDATATGTDADIVGLMTAAGLTEKTLTQAEKISGSETLKVFAELVNGIQAARPSDLKAVFAVGANTLWSHTLANTGASVDTTIAEFLRRFGLTWMTRGKLEAATDADDFAAFIGLGRGIDGAGVCPIWSNGELIRNPYGGAKTGEVELTLGYLWNFGLPRPSNFARIKFVA